MARGEGVVGRMWQVQWLFVVRKERKRKWRDHGKVKGLASIHAFIQIQSEYVSGVV